MDSELEKLKAEIARLRAELDSRDAEMDGERRAMLFMLEDTNRSTEEMEKANARLREEMEVTSHLLVIAEATAHTTDVDRLMEQVVSCAHEIAQCDTCLSYLWDREAKAFRPCKAHGLSHDTVPLFMTETLDKNVGLVHRALGGKEPFVVLPLPSQVREWAGAAFSWISYIGTLVAIPLSGKTGPLGLVVGIYTKETAITGRTEAVMRGISYQVSVALEQARLYRESIDGAIELSRKIETIQAMHEIDRSILSTLEPQEILETAVRQVWKVVSCDRATVALVDKEKEGFTFAAGYGLNVISKGTTIRFEDSIMTDVLKTGRTIYISNLMEIGELPVFEKKVAQDGFISQLRIPLTIKNEIAGVLMVGSKRPAAFTPQYLSALEKIASQIGVALSNARLISDLEELFLGTVKSLSSAIDAKSPWTAGHSQRVTRYALDIAKQMGLSEKELKELELAGLLHDVGKIGTYEAVLDKPDKLTPEEQAIMRQHVSKSAEILLPIKQLKEVIPGIRAHHEFYDGTGYPDGLKGDDIPLFGRILAVADTFDAMSADRPYRTGRTMEFMINELKRCSGTQFDPEVVEALLKTIGGREEFKMAAS